MAENDPRQQVQIRLDESRMQTTYANTIRTVTGPDEVILDFGLNVPTQSNDGKPAMMIAINSRVVMNWVGAKRLALSLSQIIQQYEQARGEIKLNPQQG